jgi:hypothetical protein
LNRATEAPDIARAHRYGDAWNAHGLDEIMSMQIAEMEFELEVAEHFASSSRNSGHALRDPIAARGRRPLRPPVPLHRDPRGAVPVDGQVVEAAGQRVDLDGVDVITTSGGLVESKHTYMDAFAPQSQLGIGAPEAAAAG